MAIQFFIVLVSWTWQLSAGSAPAQAVTTDKRPIRIGMVRSFVGDGENLKLGELWTSRKKLAIMDKLFADFVREQTGMESKLVVGGDYLRMARKLNDKQLDIGVLHGFEYAWVQRDFPALKPLLIAVYRDRNLSACLMVRDDSPAKEFAELKGNSLAMPVQSKGPCRLYLERLCQAHGSSNAKSFFKLIERPGNVRAALDDLVYGSVEAALVDSELLESYSQLKPGCFKRLRLLAQSDPFPAAVLVHRPGVIDARSLAAFRQGLIKARETITGRDGMLMFKIGAFETPPSDFDQQLAEIRAAYPPRNAGDSVSTAR